MNCAVAFPLYPCNPCPMPGARGRQRKAPLGRHGQGKARQASSCHSHTSVRCFRFSDVVATGSNRGPSPHQINQDFSQRSCSAARRCSCGLLLQLQHALGGHRDSLCPISRSPVTASTSRSPWCLPREPRFQGRGPSRNPDWCHSPALLKISLVSL